MALVSDLINEAFEDLGVLAVGETITTAEQTDAFLRLNQMIASWSREGLTVPQEAHGSFTLIQGVSDYTLGTGGILVIPSPAMRVTGASSKAFFVGATAYTAVRQPCRLISFDEFNATVSNPLGISGVLVDTVAADRDSPNINIRVHPTPNLIATTVLELNYWIAIPSFATVGDTVAFPQGYEHAIHNNLAVILYPMYGRPGGIDPVLAANAQNGKQALVQLNAEIAGKAPVSPAPPPRAA